MPRGLGAHGGDEAPSGQGEMPDLGSAGKGERGRKKKKIPSNFPFCHRKTSKAATQPHPSPGEKNKKKDKKWILKVFFFKVLK